MHLKHRQAFLDQMEAGDLALFPGSSHVTRNHDVDFPFRQNSDFAYLTGFHEAEAHLMLAKDVDGVAPETIFVLERDPLQETWHGRRVGPEGAVEKLGFGAAEEIGKLKSFLSEAMAKAKRMWFRLGAFPQTEKMVIGIVDELRKKIRLGIEPPMAFLDPGNTLHEMRLIKSADELDWMRKAAAVSAEAHMLAMAQTKPGVNECEIEALLHYTFRRHGGDGTGWAYPAIVAGGNNANILHYTENNVALKDGDLLLVDAGAEFGGYAADITRTYPVNGKYSAAQKDVYECVLAAEKAAIAVCKAEVSFHEVHNTALKVICEGLHSLGVLKESAEEIEESGAYRNWFMHNTSHWIGRDVHDAGRYMANGESRPLQPGMCLTVEPGLYFPADDERVPAALRGIGIRIEDDIHVTGGEPEILTIATPKSLADVEEACASERVMPPTLDSELISQ